MPRTLALSLALAIGATAAGSASAQPVAQEETMIETRAADVLAVLQAAKPAEEVFSQAFLSQVSAEQLAQVNAQLSEQFGAPLAIESVEPLGPGRATIAIRFERAIGSGPMVLNEAGLVEGLLFNEFQPIDDSATKILSDLEALPGTVSALYAPLGDSDPLLALNADVPLAIGSTFKLYILSALSRAIEAGKHRWDEVVTLDTRSLPSGRMQDWPQGAPVTVHTLATMMISISDNTATDALIDLLGREAVEAELRASHSEPDRTLPFLTTLELFALKGDPAMGARYVAADEAGRRAILADFADDIGGDPAKIVAPTFIEPTAIDTLEWFASADDLRALLARLTEQETALEIMAVNTSLPEPEQARWAYAGYKGGSEPGVLDLTWLLRSESGEWRILTLTQNDPDAPLDNDALELMALRVLALGR